MGNGWSIIEGPDFERGPMQCGGMQAIEEIIAPVKFGLSRNPEGFPETNVTGIYLARTKLRFNGPDILLAHRVWFRLHRSERTVELLFVEVVAADEMLDDEVPF